MRRLLLCFVFIAGIVWNINAGSKEVYFMTSADVNINQNGYQIGFTIPDYNNLNLYKASLDNDSVQVIKSDKAELFNTFNNSVDQNILFYVHGYGKQMEDVYNRALLIQDTYNVKVVFFFWPYMTSKEKPSNLFQSHKNIQKSLPVFDGFINLANELKDNNKHVNISFMAHSLGNYFLKLYSMEEDRDSHLVFDNLILNSAAVNDKKHGDWLARLDLQKRTYVLYNNHDFLLKGLQLFTRAKRQLGNKTNKFKISGVNYIDLSEVVGFRRPVRDTHSYFTGEILDELVNVKHMYTLILRGEKIEESDYYALGL